MSKIPEQITGIKGKQIALTGKLLGMTRSETAQRIRRKGGSVASTYRVTSQTVLLVRGDSENWKYGSHGIKEKEAAKRICQGQPLAIMEIEEFEKVLKGKNGHCSNTVLGKHIDDLAPLPANSTPSKVAEILGELEKPYLKWYRREQRHIRRHLFKNDTAAICQLCGVTFPTELMVAAHIKPRAACSDDEKRDYKNIAFGVCALGCDSLYEQGYLSVTDGGIIVTRYLQGLPLQLSERLKAYSGRYCPSWRTETQIYFYWHLVRQFQGTTKNTKKGDH